MTEKTLQISFLEKENLNPNPITKIQQSLLKLLQSHHICNNKLFITKVLKNHKMMNKWYNLQEGHLLLVVPKGHSSLDLVNPKSHTYRYIKYKVFFTKSANENL